MLSFLKVVRNELGTCDSEDEKNASLYERR
jgi:hypothetical protein